MDYKYILSEIICLYLLGDFFLIKKHGDSALFGKSFETNASRVFKLYKKIKEAKELSRRYILEGNFAIVLRSIIDTIYVISSSKMKNLLYALLSPKKINNCYSIPYFHCGEFYYALIPARNSHYKEYILSVSGFPSRSKFLTLKKIWSRLFLYPIDTWYDDITQFICKYVGPDGDFYNQHISPRDFGYDFIYFELLTDNGNVIKLTFKHEERINLKHSC